MSMNSYDYIRDGAEIYRRSFAMIRAESDLSGIPADAEGTVVRMIHACGQTDLAVDVRVSAGCVAAARAALTAGAPILCDAQMVASGVTRKRLPADNDVLCFLGDERIPGLAAELGTTRTAAALELWRPLLAGSVVAIGNAPTALFALLEMIDAGAPAPAAIVGAPVGFIGAAESCAALHARDDVEYVTVLGRRGGSAITAAALNALASTAE
jgi:precorrin-8X/cobalt-precorrin-8 methylmutase